MKSFKKITLFSLLLLTMTVLAVAQPKGEKIVIGESFSLTSKVLNEERPYLIYLPEDYDPKGNPVSVMYLMDGDGHFHHTSGIVSFLKSQGRIPSMMIVAIPNTTDRTRDLTTVLEKDEETRKAMPTAGGADKMLQFMKEELIPHIDKQYHTNDYRLLVGHSFGGIFAVEALLTQGDLYDGYIAISPSMWWDQQNLVNKAETFLNSKPQLDSYFYMTMGDEGGSMLSGAMKLAALFEEKSPEGFQWDFKVMKEETHGSIPHRSTYYGLEAIFKDWYRADLAQIFVDGGIKGIEQHYATVSKKLGHEIKPAENELNQLGYALLRRDNHDKAIEVFQENVKRYPHSYNVYDSLGEAYKITGDTKAAIKNYKRSVEIHPGNVNGVKILKEMGVDYDPLSKAADLPENALTVFAGKYEVSSGGVINMEIESGQLIALSDNGMPRLTLKPVYENGFIAQPANLLVQFQTDGSGKVKGFEAQVGPGQYIQGKRK